MAITLADFTKIWASTSPLTPYTFSDANYKQGWNFVGATPPARQMWDSIQKQNDEKMEYIVNNFLPTAGGTMTGIIKKNGDVINAETDDDVLIIRSASDPNVGGANIGLYGKDSSNTGAFAIYANDGVDNVGLIGRTNGNLAWGGKVIERVNASGTDYIRYESGLQICWDYKAQVPHNTATTWTLPAAFKDNQYRCFGSCNQGNYGATTNISIESTNTTTATIYQRNTASSSMSMNLFAIGWWK